jgi:isopenicillin N synthase-like dioxygenase
VNEPTVPIVDIAPFLAGGTVEKVAVARALDDACRRIGFLIVSGHGVPRSVIDDALEATWSFFDLDDTEKRRWISPKGDFRRGYMPVGGNALAYTLGQETPPDLIEAFTFGRFDLPADPYYSAHRDTWFEPNIWPDRPADFRVRLCTYYRAMEKLSADLMRVFAVALDMPETFFTDKIDRHITALRLNHYAAPDRAPLPGQLRAGPHTDYGSLTILLPTAAAGGLQVRGTDGAWHDVSPPPDTFVVNLGDLMAQWTNDCWVSTLHQVVNPPSEAGADSRRASIAFFHQPNYDAVIECLLTCQSAVAPARYAPTTSGAHLLSKTAKETGGTGTTKDDPR